MMDQIVYVVDDDAIVCESITMLVEKILEVTTESYESGDAFLANESIRTDACLVLDQRMPGLNGTEVLQHLKIREIELPTIMMSGYSNPMSDTDKSPSNLLAFLEKPCDIHEMLELIRKGLTMSRQLPKQFTGDPPS